MKINEIRLGAILSYVIIGLNMIIGICYTPILVRMLGQSEYGLYSLISNVIAYLTVLDLGFGNAITIYTARYRKQQKKEEMSKLYGMFLIIYSIIGIIAAIIGVVLYFNVSNMFSASMNEAELEKAKVLMLILTLNLAITFPLSIFSSIITGYEKFVFSKLVNIVRTLLTPLIMIPLLFMGGKSISLVIIITILNIGSLLINLVYCMKKIKIKFVFGKFNIPLLKEIFQYSFFIFLNTIIDKISWNLDQFILGKYCGTIAVSIYAVASQLNIMYMNFSTAISGVLLPKVTKMEAENATDKEFTKVFIKTGRIQYIVLALIITGFILFGKSFIIMWAGIEYVDAYIIACILMIPITVPLIQNLGLSILQAKNKYKYRTIIFLLIAVLNVFISIPLAKIYEGIGCAIGTAIAEILGQIIILNIYYYKKVHINMKEFWKEILRMTIPVAIAFILGICILQYFNIIRITSLIIAILIYSIIYILLMWKMGMNHEEKEMISNIYRTIHTGKKEK